ncbi:MAG: vWA domain-containing protein [Myxococcota bacterium]
MVGVLWALLAWVGAAVAEPSGSEIVVILDNSCSMAAESGFNNVTVPANDPERLAVLGAQVVADLGKSGVDEVTVLGFGPSATAPPVTADSGDAIRGWNYANGTFFRNTLTRADQIFKASQRDEQLLIFLTDGVPSPEDNIRDTDDLRAIFDPTAHPRTDVLAVGLFNHPEVRSVGTTLLGALARSPDDVQAVSSAEQIIEAFTVGFARAIGSRPETGTLSAGERHEIKVGLYVSEVIAVAVSRQPGPAFHASLESPWGPVPPLGSGDNGCTAAVARQLPPAVCSGPHRHYQVFRKTNNPEHRTQWALSLADGSDEIQYGIILRYDLAAGVDVPATVAAGTTVPIRARLIFRDETFDDDEFFGSDGFSAVAKIGDEEIPMIHAGDGIFTAEWTPADDRDDNRQAIVEVVFRNEWMEKSAKRPVTVTPPPYLLTVQEAMTLSPVPSTWAPSSLCGTLSLAGSRNIEDVDLSCEIRDRPLGVGFTCERSGPETLQVCAETRRWCCGKTGDVTVDVAGPGGTPPRTADSSVVTFEVENPGFLKCYWLPISITLMLMFLGWFIYGWIRPYSFDGNATVTIAGSEKGLRRATPQILQECPGGKRGFYRNARIGLNGAGDMVRKTSQALILLEARPNQSSTFLKAPGLEQRDRRTRKWEPVPEEELREGYISGQLYRLGDLYIKFE